MTSKALRGIKLLSTLTLTRGRSLYRIVSSQMTYFSYFYCIQFQKLQILPIAKSLTGQHIFQSVIQIIMNKLALPESSATVEFKVQGIFGTPDEWKTTDDSNPGLFTYSVRFLQFQIEKGKIFPRELTGKELREQEEKNKKGGKKQSKKEDANAQEQRIKKIQEEQERKRQEQWNKLPEEDRNYRQYEDTFKSPQLKFENNNKKSKFQGKNYTILQQRVSKDQGQWIYVYKMPLISEDQMAKMRKSKPKTLSNINDLNPIQMRAWVDLTSLNSKDKTKIIQRCKLSQIDKTAETSEPNLENTYIKIAISLQSPIQKADDGVNGEQLIADPPQPESLSEKIKVVNELRDQLRLAITSLSMEYSTTFWKDLNIYEDLKNMNYFVNKKNQLTKRKEQFLYDFNVSGKYKILKDRMKKVIVHLCESYFTEQMGSSKSFTGISCTIKDQFYSEIYTFLVTKYKKILHQLIFQKKENLNQIQVLSVSAQRKNVQKLLNSYHQELPEERITRIIKQYQLLGNNQYGQLLFRKYMQAQPLNVGLKYTYSMYCLRNNLKKAQQILPFVQQYLSYNKDDQKVRLQYLLLLIASQNEQNCKKAWVLLRQIIDIDPINTKNLVLASFLFKDILTKQQIGVSISAQSQRSYLRSTGKIAEVGKHKQKPTPSELPSLKALPTYAQSLTSDQQDSLWIQILKQFLNLNLYNIIEKITPKIKNTTNNIFNILSLKQLLNEARYKEFQSQAKEIFQKNKSIEILELLVTYYLSQKGEQTQKYLKLLLVRSKGETKIHTLLRMAYFYLETKQIGNARACILKYLQKEQWNSGYSWRILGICQLQLGQLSTSLECLRKANIADIDNSQNWLWLAKIYTLLGQYSMCNQCLNQYQIMTAKQPNKMNYLYQDISRIVSNSKSDDLVEDKLRVQLISRLG